MLDYWWYLIFKTQCQYGILYCAWEVQVCNNIVKYVFNVAGFFKLAQKKTKALSFSSITFYKK